MPLDIDKAFGPGGWGLTEFQLRRGVNPDRKKFAAAWRQWNLSGGQPIPPLVQQYIGRLIDGTMKRRRGRPRETERPKSTAELLTKALEYVSIRDAYDNECARIKREKKPGELIHVSDEAKERVSQRFGRSPDQIDRILWPRPRRRSSRPR